VKISKTNIVKQNSKTQPIMTKKGDERIAELEKENQKLKEDNISQMFNSIITLIKTENEKVLGKIEIWSEKTQAVNTRQISLEEKIIPGLREEIETLRLQKQQCPVTTGLVKKDLGLLADRVLILENETVIPRDMAKYPKLMWTILLIITLFGSGVGLAKFVQTFFLP